MSRERIVPTAIYEDIISYTYHKYSKVMLIQVGHGLKDLNGNFIPTPDQVYETITLYDNDVDEILAPSAQKPEGVFRPDDLWPLIDKARNFIPVPPVKIPVPPVVRSPNV